MEFNFEAFANQIVGQWKGEGKGVFPTIDDFEYIEHLTFKKDEDRAIIHYEQKTWLKSSTLEKGRSSHWESGFISFEDKEQHKVYNVHGNGRMETLDISDIEVFKNGCKLLFSSKLIMNDTRMVTSSREWIFDQRKMNYTMSMRTEAVANKTVHLTASLLKVL